LSAKPATRHGFRSKIFGKSEKFDCEKQRCFSALKNLSGFSKPKTRVPGSIVLTGRVPNVCPPWRTGPEAVVPITFHHIASALLASFVLVVINMASILLKFPMVDDLSRSGCFAFMWERAVWRQEGDTQ
jgi:hypothetical protein